MSHGCQLYLYSLARRLIQTGTSILSHTTHLLTRQHAVAHTLFTEVDKICTVCTLVRWEGHWINA